MKLPVRVQIEEVLSSRYQYHQRPESWDERMEGSDVVRTTDSQDITLFSDGGQNVPQPGWVILLMGGDSSVGYTWTLYGMPKATSPQQPTRP